MSKQQLRQRGDDSSTDLTFEYRQLQTVDTLTAPGTGRTLSTSHAPKMALFQIMKQSLQRIKNKGHNAAVSNSSTLFRLAMDRGLVLIRSIAISRYLVRGAKRRETEQSSCAQRRSVRAARSLDPELSLAS